MMTRGGEGGKKCRKFDDVICERPLSTVNLAVRFVGVRNLVRRGTATENQGFYFAVNVILIQYANCNHCIYCFKAFVPIWLGSTCYQRVLFDCNKI